MEWLEIVNSKFAEKEVHYKDRPGLALGEWAAREHQGFALSSIEANEISSWFEAHSRAGAHALGELFTGAFYFDSCFWPVTVPIGYGTVKLRALDSLKTMPVSIRQMLIADQHSLSRFIEVWLNCIDYATGLRDAVIRANASSEKLPKIKEVRGNKGEEFIKGEEMLNSGDKELRASVSLLLEQTPSSKALECSALAAEMFMKAFIAVKRLLAAKKPPLTEEEAINLSHSLNRILDACLEEEPQSELGLKRGALASFPLPHERYKAKARSRSGGRKLWEVYDVAQFISTTVVRALSGRDIRKSGKITGV